ncbi:hypothetical protein BCR43DRAFT_324966 [Syncephalastrum racemosum]|uniref:C2H2-type domain-containing protein n=1 Tax=Syncephalastrum racemosum TaxID=13706 RepID=A0A1X2H7M4_SYNRA|nr:hypothetical protein BCR43DRAFT_324966 [Syncephalastrum racemosum]
MEYPWKCRQRRCRAKFKSELQLTKHCNEMHNEFDSDQAPVMCPYAGCNRSFKSTDLQIDHLFLVHKPPQKGKENVCAWPDCGKEFGYHYNLWTHVRNKHIREKNPKIECEAEGCDRTFIDKQSYSCHFRKFHPENLVSCDICYSVTSCPLKVNEHKQRFHNPLNTFVCTYCSKRYSAKAGLLLHQRKACRLANKKQ